MKGPLIIWRYLKNKMGEIMFSFHEINTNGRNLLTDLTIKKISSKILVKRNGLSYVGDKIDARHSQSRKH